MQIKLIEKDNKCLTKNEYLTDKDNQSEEIVVYKKKTKPGMRLIYHVSIERVWQETFQDGAGVANRQI